MSQPCEVAGSVAWKLSSPLSMFQGLTADLLVSISQPLRSLPLKSGTNDGSAGGVGLGSREASATGCGCTAIGDSTAASAWCSGFLPGQKAATRTAMTAMPAATAEAIIHG